MGRNFISEDEVSGDSEHSQINFFSLAVIRLHSLPIVLHDCMLNMEACDLNNSELFILFLCHVKFLSASMCVFVYFLLIFL